MQMNTIIMNYCLQGNSTTIYALSFFTGNWSNNFLQEAINKLKVDRELSFYWKKLLQKVLIPESQVRLSCKVLSAFVRKFTKRRCVTYLTRDGLAPKHKEDEPAVRQMLKKFNEK